MASPADRIGPSSDAARRPDGEVTASRPAESRAAAHDVADYCSILYESKTGLALEEQVQAPPFFVDLNLDQVVAAVTGPKHEYDLVPIYHVPVTSPDAAYYRHEVMRDLQTPDLYEAVTRFAAAMRGVREKLTRFQKFYYKHQKESWFRDAVEDYCGGITRLAADLEGLPLKSRGFVQFRRFLSGYATSTAFTAMAAEAQRIREELAGVEYCMLLYGSGVTVRKYHDEYDYSAAVLATFDKFKQGDVKDHRVKFTTRIEMDHVEAAILTRVATLFPEVFEPLQAFTIAHADFIDDTVQRFDREVQFYIAYLDHMRPLERAGLKFCFPELASEPGNIRSESGFDLALGHKLVSEHAPVVCNDFHLSGPERIFVVSGPNQGGKTTFARTFGQLHYLANLGLPVPGSSARLMLFDHLFTHFERQEDMKSLRGKLEDDLVRVHEILESATRRSVIVMNESFSSTALSDALFLGRKVLGAISRLDAVCVYVTFIDELSRLNPKTVSMVSQIVPQQPAERTFKILRKPADGFAHAMTIAEKYNLTCDSVKKRIQP